MRLLSLLVFAGIIGCQQKPGNTTQVVETRSVKQTPSSFSSPDIPKETFQSARLPRKQVALSTSSYADLEEWPDEQYELPAETETNFIASVQRFVTASRSELLKIERPEVFILQPEQLATVETAAGTKIVIHTSDLETIDGKPATGLIKLQVKEMCKPGDMLKMHAPTISDGAMLETGGSWHISATAEGRQLRMKEGKEYTINLPLTQNSEQPSNVFYGNLSTDGTVNWQPADAAFEPPMINQLQIVAPEFSFSQPRRKIDKLSFASKGLMTEAPYSYYGSFVLEYIEVAADRFDAQTLRNIRKKGKHAKYKTSAGLKDENTLKMYVRTGGMSIYRDSGIVKYVFEPKSGSSSYKIVIDSLALTGESKVLTSKTKDIINQKIARNIAKMAKDRDEYFAAIENKNSFQKAVSRATASLSRFGWINCDKFYKQDERIEYYTSVQTERRAEAMVVYMIFKNINSILNSNYSGQGSFVFSAVPPNEEVMLVAIGKSGDDLLYAQTGYYKLQKGQPVSLQLQKVTTEEMTAKINALQ